MYRESEVRREVSLLINRREGLVETGDDMASRNYREKWLIIYSVVGKEKRSATDKAIVRFPSPLSLFEESLIVSPRSET